MKPLAIAIAVVASLATAAAAQPKRDVHGFSTGMTTSDVTKRRTEIGGCKQYQCTVSGGTVTFGDQQHALSRLLVIVKYEFKSGTDPTGMIEHIAKEYQRRPVPADHKKLIDEATSVRPHQSRHFGTMLVTGGDIASWKIGDAVMVLYVGNRQPPYEYQLTMTDHRLHEADKKAKRDAEAAQKRKSQAVNPAPKF